MNEQPPAIDRNTDRIQHVPARSQRGKIRKIIFRMLMEKFVIGGLVWLAIGLGYFSTSGLQDVLKAFDSALDLRLVAYQYAAIFGIIGAGVLVTASSTDRGIKRLAMELASSVTFVAGLAAGLGAIELFMAWGYGLALFGICFIHLALGFALIRFAIYRKFDRAVKAKEIV